MQPPVLERLGGPIQHRACFLEGGHTVLGDDLLGNRTTDGGPGRCLGRRTWLGVLVLEQQPAKRDSNKCRNEKGVPDAPTVVAADGPQLRAGQLIGGLRHLGTSRPAQSYRSSTVTNGPQQPDDYLPSMTIAFMVLAAVHAAVNGSWMLCVPNHIWRMPLCGRALRRHKPAQSGEARWEPGSRRIGCSHERGDAHVDPAASTLCRATHRLAGADQTDPPRRPLPGAGLG